MEEISGLVKARLTDEIKEQVTAQIVSQVYPQVQKITDEHLKNLMKNQVAQEIQHQTRAEFQKSLASALGEVQRQVASDLPVIVGAEFLRQKSLLMSDQASSSSARDDVLRRLEERLARLEALSDRQAQTFTAQASMPIG